MVSLRNLHRQSMLTSLPRCTLSLQMPYLEHAEVAEVCAIRHSLSQGCSQRLDVPEAQIHALPRQRVDRMGGIPNECHARPHVPARCAQ